MARFSLSPPASSSVRRQERQQQQRQQQPSSSSSSSSPTSSAPQWKWNFPPQDEYYRPRPSTSSSTSSSSSSSEEDEDEDSDYDDRCISSSSSDDDEHDDDEEEEPPHPLGFESSPSYGRTRFGLAPVGRDGDPPPSRGRWDAPDDGGDDRAWNALIRIDDSRRDSVATTTLPVRSYNLDLRGTRVSSGALLRGAAAGEEDAAVGELRSGMDRIAELVAAAGLVGDYVDRGDDDWSSSSRRRPTAPPAPLPPPPPPPRSASRLLQLASACERLQSDVKREMSELERESASAHRRSCRGLLLLLRADDELASAACSRIADRRRRLEEEEEVERLEGEAREEALRTTAAEDERARAERAAVEGERLEEGRRREGRRRRAEEDAARAAEEEDAKGSEHVRRAIDLVSRVEDVRSGLLRAFETSPAASRRRLLFKKVVNGRINTLSHDGGKVRDVSDAVVDAIAQASRDDDDAAARAPGGGGDPALTVGRRYLLDLLCSNLIVRVQADGFNGTRGDGFPLAAMFASVSARCAEICPLLEGHLYRVCPTAVPALSLARGGDRGTAGGGGGGGGGGVEGNGSENGNNNNDVGEDLMESLGMIRDKDGEFESFDKWLHRTEGLISIMANIMSSLPSDHTLLGGHAGALTWLRRFVDLLPPAPASPLPLLTAPVLVAFLTGAGHMLASRYPGEFAPLLDGIKGSVVRRLDDSPVGLPSATRLRKVLDDVGFEGLRRDLPNGAVVGLYDDGKGGGSAGGASDAFAGAGAARTFSGMSSSADFGLAHISSSSAFSGTTLGGSAGGEADRTDDPFTPSDWGGSPTGDSEFFGVSSKVFTAPVNNASSSWGTSSSPFASDGGGGGGFGPSTVAAPSPSPFGGVQSSWAPATAPSPFGGVGQSSGFGVAAVASAPSAGFAPATTPSPFGGVGQSSGFGIVATAPASSTGFALAAAPSPFGVVPSPFGGGEGQSSGFGFASAATSSGFGVFTAPAPSPFGGVSAPAAAGFGPSTFASTASKQTSPFGAGGFGVNPSSAPALSQFANNSGWQGLGNNTGGQGGNKKQPCKFFAGGTCSFGDRCKFSHEIGGIGQGQIGGGGNPSPFGNLSSGNPSGNFDGSGGKQPCKFFASGQCKHGSACRFSHELPGGAGASGFGNGTAFGGSGFGKAGNPSPFSGGGATGGVFGVSQFGSASTSNTSRNSNPFGGPRR